jgi:putative membrane protein insertion efficiency factor
MADEPKTSPAVRSMLLVYVTEACVRSGAPDSVLRTTVSRHYVVPKRQTAPSRSKPPLVHRVLDRMLGIHKRRFAGRVGPRCIFTPTCSEYAVTAIKTHGLLRGLKLSVNRILRCNDRNQGGNDPVPGARHV